MRRAFYAWFAASARVPIPSVKDEAEIEGEDVPLLDAILADEQRDVIPGSLPVVSVHENDEPDYLEAIRARERTRMTLARRGQHHGSLVELTGDRTQASGRLLVKRWKNASPLLLPGLFAERAAELASPASKLEQLSTGSGLRNWLDAKASAWSSEFEVSDEAHAARDPERDLESVSIRSRGEDSDVRLWLKTAKLSTHEGDASFRLRVSFGDEIEDDASADERAHAATARLAKALFPAANALNENEELAQTLRKGFGGSATFSQHILYSNAPGGGARFHHDAFGLPDPSGQRGVAYTQLTGSTLWLALSIRALAQNVRLFAEMLADGELRTVREELFPAERLVRFVELARDESRCIAELAKPGCGELGPVVDLGPEFTSLLADGGHALRLEAGDVLLLPNHGFDRTAMHSVFCASDQLGEALSVAIRKA